MMPATQVFLCVAVAVGCLPAMGAAQMRQEAEDAETLITAEAAETAQSIRRRINRFRKSQGLKELTSAEDLQQAAMSFAAFMARTHEYGHEADGRDPAERATAAGYRYCRVAENIAYRFRSRDLLDDDLTKLFVRGWKRSPGHRENLLDPDVTETGVGVAFDPSRETAYAVQLFGRPRSERLKIVITNRSQQKVVVQIETTGKVRRVEMPNQSRLEVSRCYPTTLSLEARSGGTEREPTGQVEVEQSQRLVIKNGRNGQPRLVAQRRDRSGG